MADYQILCSIWYVTRAALLFWHSFPTGTMVHMLGIVAIAPNNPHHVHGHDGTTGWETFVTFSWLDNCGMQPGVPHLHCLYDFLSVRLSVCLTLCLSDRLSVLLLYNFLSVWLSLSDILFIWLSVCRTFCLSEFISVCLTESDRLSDCLGACLSGWLVGWVQSYLAACLSSCWCSEQLLFW